MTKEDRIDQIHHKLTALEGYLVILRRKGKVTAEMLIANDDLRGVVERNLQLAAEVVLDVANQLIAEYRFRTPTEYKDSIIILGEEGVLEKDFADEISGMAGFRNLLVHDYLKIDYEKVADKVNNRLGDFETFAKSVARYVS